jgi:uncharacterized protein (DUF2141 family)
MFSINIYVIIAISVVIIQWSSPKFKERTVQIEILTNEFYKEISKKTREVSVKDKTEILEDKTIIKRVPLTITVTNLKSATAPVVIGVYKSQYRFLYKEGRYKEYKFIPRGNEITVKIVDLSYGEYALAIYQDENSSGKVDKNALGIPKERYAFSNNFRPRMKAPTYNDCKFKYNSSSHIVSIKLIK